jgi:hypothetical protein
MRAHRTVIRPDVVTVRKVEPTTRHAAPHKATRLSAPPHASPRDQPRLELRPRAGSRYITWNSMAWAVTRERPIATPVRNINRGGTARRPNPPVSLLALSAKCKPSERVSEGCTYRWRQAKQRRRQYQTHDTSEPCANTAGASTASRSESTALGQHTRTHRTRCTTTDHRSAIGPKSSGKFAAAGVYPTNSSEVIS